MISTADADRLVAELRGGAKAHCILADQATIPEIRVWNRTISNTQKEIADRLAAMNSRSAG